jgi:multiple sugar transport system ATP-binding protein
MASITLDHLGKAYTPEVTVIRDLSFDIKDGEFMVFVGPSGCGKSTVLRMIAGLETITSGTLSIGDRVVNDVHPKDRDIAMVFQSYALYPHMTVYDNIAFGLQIRKIDEAEIKKRVQEAADTLGLNAYLDRKPKALSGGQRQRVALGRAIVRKPSVFLFDEPLSNLDAELRVQMRAELAKLQHKLQTTTVYVTHDQVEAMTLGHRIAVLAPMGKERKTNLKQVGTPLELYDRPQNVFVAKFIGTPPMNMVKATVNADGTQLQASGFATPVPDHLHAALKPYAGREVLLGVRPEHVGDAGAHSWTLTAPLGGSVEIIETIGHEVIVHFRCGEDMVIAKLGAHRIPAFGERVDLVLDSATMHLFDPQTEQRIPG